MCQILAGMPPQNATTCVRVEIPSSNTTARKCTMVGTSNVLCWIGRRAICRSWRPSDTVFFTAGGSKYDINRMCFQLTGPCRRGRESHMGSPQVQSPKTATLAKNANITCVQLFALHSVHGGNFILVLDSNIHGVRRRRRRRSCDPALAGHSVRQRGYRQSRLDPISSAPAVGSVGLLWQSRTSFLGLSITGPPHGGSREKPDGQGVGGPSHSEGCSRA